ncbi:hypothetical protein CERSUDRAFT_118460 [Gelatoporia subvermispora B]|uniref:Uncharacterized protein n=1 Tax=Ceriporiopsis subvermispora (strain B) TaxID=914234 RepID=M2Q797_CERS8|nr:hypothetical protein CERSUDRAFT_118460 [Gelatoporia subvermispora B]
MPAPEIDADARESRPVLGHVNLMVDTFIANANLDDLRAIVRGMLATSPPTVASAFTAAARQRLVQTNATAPPSAGALFAVRPGDGMAEPKRELKEVLSRARTLYGSGMGFASLRVLAEVVRATVGLKWEEESDMDHILAAIDADISQAIQSSREELEGERVTGLERVRGDVNVLREAVSESQKDTAARGIGFPFERGAASLNFWKM